MEVNFSVRLQCQEMNHSVPMIDLKKNRNLLSKFHHQILHCKIMESGSQKGVFTQSTKIEGRIFFKLCDTCNPDFLPKVQIPLGNPDKILRHGKTWINDRNFNQWLKKHNHLSCLRNGPGAPTNFCICHNMSLPGSSVASNF